jgi:hypothetical protein
LGKKILLRLFNGLLQVVSSLLRRLQLLLHKVILADLSGGLFDLSRPFFILLVVLSPEERNLLEEHLILLTQQMSSLLEVHHLLCITWLWVL